MPPTHPPTAELPSLLALRALVIASARSGFPELKISPETRERLAGLNDPLARFLKSLVGGGVPHVPHDLPTDVRSMLEDLLQIFEGSRPDEPESD